MSHNTYIVQNTHDRHQVFGFRQWDDFLKSLPCRQTFFDDNFHWPHGKLVADCATVESARKVIPDEAQRITKLPWPESLPINCELWLVATDREMLSAAVQTLAQVGTQIVGVAADLSELNRFFKGA